MSPRSPTQAEVLRLALEHRLTQLHTCMPGEVVSYDASTQTADVRLSLKQVVFTTEGEDALEVPVIPSVKVAHPRGGGWFVHLPLAPGDHVMVHFAERSMDAWRDLGGVQDPLDLRKHDFSDAVAVPGNLYPDTQALAGLANDHLTIGQEGGSSIHINADGSIALGSAVPADAAATALKVAAQLQALKTAFSTWVPVPNDGGLALKVILTALLVTGWPADVSSTKIKIDP